MDLLVADATFADFEGDPKGWVADLESELRAFDSDVVFERTDIGHGADWPMILAVFSGIGTVFLLGEKVEKSLDAWQRLGRRFVALLVKIQKRFGSTRIDETGAQLIAVCKIVDDGPTTRFIEAVTLVVLPIEPFADRDPARLDSRTNALYIQGYLVNDEHLYVLGITSSGRVDFVMKYGANSFNFEPPAT